ncbi:MAG: hypothetical protein AB7F66_08775 [Bacteriovoracia bacterium]
MALRNKFSSRVLPVPAQPTNLRSRPAAPALDRKLVLRDQRGFSIVSATISSAILIVGLLAAAQGFEHSMKAGRNVSGLHTYNSLMSTTQLLLNGQKSCVGAFQNDDGSLVQYQPPLMGSPAVADPSYSVTVNRLMLGTSPLLSVDSSSPNQEVKITDLRLQSRGLAPDEVTLLVGGATKIYHRHVVDLNITGEKTGLILGARQLTKSFTIAILTNPTESGQVVQCLPPSEGGLGSPTLEIAVAKRVGIALYNRDCVEPVANIDPCEYNGGACTAGMSAPPPAPYAIPHPLWDQYQKPPSDPAYSNVWGKFFYDGDPDLTKLPNGITNIGPQGRCKVLAVNTPAGVNPATIFKSVNKAHPNFPSQPNQLAGLACNAAEGWRLVNCSSSNYGSGSDPDELIGQTDGHDSCFTGNYREPHLLAAGAAGHFRSLKVALSVTCMRFKQSPGLIQSI